MSDGRGAKDNVVELDVETRERAGSSRPARQRRDVKIGPPPSRRPAPDRREIVAAGARVFLDLKFHDIPAVVAAAGREAARLGVSLFTVHAAGGAEMLKRVAEAVADTAGRVGLGRPRVLGVTVLTSADDATLAETGVGCGVEEQVARLAALAGASGLDGCIASPHEIAMVRRAAARTGFLVVTPGVRPQSVAHDDQRRVLTPEQAVRAGADYVYRRAI